MEDITQQNITVLQRPEIFFEDQQHLDFEYLREKGLEHLGELSGKIWTDHNVHDPGITILEVLCYALIDLGYRTSLPLSNLLALENRTSEFEPDDNFLTPLEALTSNPTTITDYRKLFLEIEGVRNAWIEVAHLQEQELYLNFNSDDPPGEIYELSYAPDGCPQGPCRPPKPPNKGRCEQIGLNGLYHILIEPEPGAKPQKIREDVRALYNIHRNICEDLVGDEEESIELLTPKRIGICADIELEEGVIPQEVYELILQRVKNYISPRLKYYTLNQLLEKGKSIEEIYAGRPFIIQTAPYCNRSFGFIDTEELENLPRRKELHQSDLYREILSIEHQGRKAVKTIRSLAFESNTTKHKNASLPGITIEDNEVASFSLDLTQINIFRGNRVLEFNRTLVHRRLLDDYRTRLERTDLDNRVPHGTYLPTLGDYYSIQNDFPLVYGIGEGHLPNDTPPDRRAKAFQLKGYLLFYDQLLVNYLSQISHIRDLFSLKQESLRDASLQRTYFTQTLSTVPDVERLQLLFKTKDWVQGSSLALPVANNPGLSKKLQHLAEDPRQSFEVRGQCIDENAVTIEDATNVKKDAQQEIISQLTADSAPKCNVFVQQAVRDIKQGDFVIEVHQERAGYFFVICFTESDNWVLVSHQRYRNHTEALEAANLVVFLASLPESYQKTSRSVNKGKDSTQSIEFIFEVVYNPTIYTTYLQTLLEDDRLYQQRRETFLDHLLARFAHQFTDYALLRFGATELKSQERMIAIEDKSRFLDNFDDVGRNRGRAFNYQEASWGTANVSGFEKRVSLLAGMKNWNRRWLCKYEVTGKHSYNHPDTDNSILFTDSVSYESVVELQEARASLLEMLRKPQNYPVLRRRLEGFDTERIKRLYSIDPADENIEPHRNTIAIQLKNQQGEIVFESQNNNYAAREEASSPTSYSAFIKEVNRSDDHTYDLEKAAEAPLLYLDKQLLSLEVIENRKYKWYWLDENGQELQRADDFFPNAESAREDFVKLKKYGKYISRRKEAFVWELEPLEGILLTSTDKFTSAEEAKKAWARATSAGKNLTSYTEKTNSRNQIQVFLNAEGISIASSTLTKNKNIAYEEFRAACIDAFSTNDEPNTRVIRNTYGFQVIGTNGNVLLTSFYLHSKIQDALADFLKTIEAAKDSNNYFPMGTVNDPVYRFLVGEPDGRFLASTPEPYFSTASELDASLGGLQKALEEVRSPLIIQEEPSEFHWILSARKNHQEDFKQVQSSKRPFSTRQDAKSNFADWIQKQFKKKPDAINSNIYYIDVHEKPYKFIYWAHPPGKNATPLAESITEFDTKLKAQKAYTEFVLGLPESKLKQPKTGSAQITHRNKPVARILGETEEAQQENKTHAKAILKHHKAIYGSSSYVPQNDGEHIYRLIDRAHPIAKSGPDCFDEAVDMCKKGGDTYPLDLKSVILRVLCPDKDPDKYHFAIHLTDEPTDTEYQLLISFIGYKTHAEAWSAGTAEYLKIIELASDKKNYGESGPIRDREIYNTQNTSIPNDCIETLPLPRGTS